MPPPPIPLPGWVSPPSKGPLPPALVVFSGRLDDLKAAQVEVNVNELQRELAVRQLERNVEELERLRRVDEERARQETERRKAAEAQKAAAIAAAKAKKNAASAPPVLPESYGATGATQQAPAAPSQPAAQQPVANAPESAEGVTRLNPKIVVEPIPPLPGQPEPGQTATSDATVAEPQGADATLDPKPAVIPRPAFKPRVAPPRRTADDPFRSPLGGFQ